MSRTPIAAFFDAAVGAADVKRGKPEPDRRAPHLTHFM